MKYDRAPEGRGLSVRGKPRRVQVVPNDLSEGNDNCKKM